MGHRIVRFTDSSDRYYDYFDRELHKNDGAIIRSKVFGGYERQLLELLVDNPGKVFSRDEIIDNVKGMITTDSECPELKSVDNHVGALRKLIDIPLKIKVIETVWGRGYRYIGTRAEDGARAPGQSQSSDLPHILTRSIVEFADSESVIHRKREITELEDVLIKGKSAILVSGFGGIGKTSLAQLLYSRLAPLYDSIGWVEYHVDLKESILSAIELENNITDAEMRWARVSYRLKNDRSRKLLFINNVDKDTGQHQDPTKDKFLTEIAGWPDLTVVLTSRIKELRGYRTYSINALGTPLCPEPCVDLFYFYYDEEYKKTPTERSDLETVEKLVKIANYHTYTIELLARSAVYENNLSDYLEKIQQIGFQFPNLSIATSHDNKSATAAGQLKLLFNLHTRGKYEQQILWDFSVLPEGIMLSPAEALQLLSYEPNDLVDLCRDSWLLHKKGQGFFIHPLVKEIMHFDLRNGKAPIGTSDNLIKLVKHETLISSEDSQVVVYRKLGIIEAACQYMDFERHEDAADFYYKLAFQEYSFARKRLTSISYLQQALKENESLDNTPENKFRTAKIRYLLGYYKSTTQKYRHMAKDDLQIALDIWEPLKCKKEAAMAHDHLGYVLSDNREDWGEAKRHLEIALSIRCDLLHDDASQNNFRDYATTCDNLGYLLSLSDDDYNRASKLLMDAFTIRNNIYLKTGNFGSEVAWTSYNLGMHYSKSNLLWDRAEEYFREAISIRRRLELKQPSVYSASIILSLVALAKLLLQTPGRLSEVKDLVLEIEYLEPQVDAEHTGFFSEATKRDIEYLENILSEKER